MGIAGKHKVFFEGAISGETEIHPVAEAILNREEMSVFINIHASEPRWEAWVGKHRAFGDDPNEVILDCAASCRRERMESLA